MVLYSIHGFYSFPWMFVPFIAVNLKPENTKVVLICGKREKKWSISSLLFSMCWLNLYGFANQNITWVHISEETLLCTLSPLPLLCHSFLYKLSLETHSWPPRSHIDHQHSLSLHLSQHPFVFFLSLSHSLSRNPISAVIPPPSPNIMSCFFIIESRSEDGRNHFFIVLFDYSVIFEKGISWVWVWLKKLKFSRWSWWFRTKKKNKVCVWGKNITRKKNDINPRF